MSRDYFWALITLVIAIILAIILLSVAREDSSTGETVLYAGVPLDEHLLPLDKRALTEAYHDHLKLLWSVWLKDGAHDATRISNGLRIARRAYHEAAQQIEKREQQLEQHK